MNVGRTARTYPRRGVRVVSYQEFEYLDAPELQAVKSSVRVVPLERVRAPLLAVALGELSNNKVPSSLLSLDANMGGELARMLAAGDFNGKPDEVAMLYPSKGAKRVLLVGLAKSEEITRGAVRRSAAIAARKATETGSQAMAFHLAPETHGGVTPADYGQVVAEGAGQGAWRFS
ncbi:MAG: hypothetical protein JSW51_09565, partial [Gemmatimonadota bacterium]